MKFPIKILYINGGVMDLGGISSYMMNYYRNFDKEKIQIDFIVHGFEKGVYDDEIIKMGGKIYNIPIKSKDYIGNKNALEKILGSGKYKIVHSHMDAMSILPLKIAKKYNIPIRIAHSHNTDHLTKNKFKYALNEYARKNIYKYCTHMFACSEKAGRWLFGDKNFENNEVRIIYNAIDYEKFRFNIDMRVKLRKKYNLDNKFVIGHVGRFDYQKNQLFLIRLLKLILAYIPNSTLVLVGDGHLKDLIKKEIYSLGLENNVSFLGSIKDINNIYSMFDIFILPSLFEGLGIVGLEAQANSLHCIFSDKVPKEVKITNKVHFESLEGDISKWVNIILTIYRNGDRKKLEYLMDCYDKYDIKTSSKNLERLYLDLNYNI